MNQERIPQNEPLDEQQNDLQSQAQAREAQTRDIAAHSGVAKTIAVGSLKALWFCVKLLGRFTWYMANMVFVVSRQRKIMDSDKSDVVKMKEMDNLRDAVDSTGFVEKENMMWTEMKKPRKRL